MGGRRSSTPQLLFTLAEEPVAAATSLVSDSGAALPQPTSASQKQTPRVEARPPSQMAVEELRPLIMNNLCERYRQEVRRVLDANIRDLVTLGIAQWREKVRRGLAADTIEAVTAFVGKLAKNRFEPDGGYGRYRKRKERYGKTA